jgi:hypothetical protein
VIVDSRTLWFLESGIVAATKWSISSSRNEIEERRFKPYVGSSCQVEHVVTQAIETFAHSSAR